MVGGGGMVCIGNGGSDKREMWRVMGECGLGKAQVVVRFGGLWEEEWMMMDDDDEYDGTVMRRSAL